MHEHVLERKLYQEKAARFASNLTLPAGGWPPFNSFASLDMFTQEIVETNGSKQDYFGIF